MYAGRSPWIRESIIFSLFGGNLTLKFQSNHWVIWKGLVYAEMIIRKGSEN